MAIKRFSAWRFAHPDFDADEETMGLGLTPTGGVSMVDGDASVRQAVMLLLSTRPGERVMLPQYGCQLDRLMFESNDDTTAGLAIHYVRRALERWEPRIEILNVDAVINEQNRARLDIELDYRVLPTRSHERISFPVNLMHPDI